MEGFSALGWRRKQIEGYVGDIEDLQDGGTLAILTCGDGRVW